MILLVDDSEERRENLLIRFRVKGYLVNATPYDELWFHTKPFITVYINPTKTQMLKIKNSEDTISMVFCDRGSVPLPIWSINFTSVKNIYDEVVNIYKERATFQIKNKIDIVGYACLRGKEFAVGGKDILLSNRELNIVRFFMNQPNKKFRLLDASGYVWIKDNQEKNYAQALFRINKKLKNKSRPKLIIYKDGWCYFNPEISSYVCEDPPEVQDTYEYKGYFMISFTEEF